MAVKRQLLTGIAVTVLVMTAVAGTGVVGANDAGTDACIPAMGSSSDDVSQNTGCGDSPSDSPGDGGGDGSYPGGFCDMMPNCDATNA